MSNTAQLAKPISPVDGPIAVTGASGYIGSWIVHDLVSQGYETRACVRDIGSERKTAHLSAMNEQGLRGSVKLYQGDLFAAGSYDDAFQDCAAVIHAGATVGYNRETPQEVYDGCFTEVKQVIDSAVKSSNLRKFVFTSSLAAVAHPRPPGYVFTEKDWCGDNIEAYRGRWSEDQIPKNRDIAYAKAKARAEKMLYQTADEIGTFDAMAILPAFVIGPVMCENHDQGWSWQNCMKFMAMGKPYKKSRGGRMLWNISDVRDVGKAHRLCLESSIAGNGSRYILAAGDRSGELFTHELQSLMQKLFPEIPEIGGEEMDGDKPAQPTNDSPRCYCLLAKQEIGLKPYDPVDSVRDTIVSYRSLDML